MLSLWRLFVETTIWKNGRRVPDGEPTVQYLSLLLQFNRQCSCTLRVDCKASRRDGRWFNASQRTKTDGEMDEEMDSVQDKLGCP